MQRSEKSVENILILSKISQ